MFNYFRSNMRKPQQEETWHSYIDENAIEFCRQKSMNIVVWVVSQAWWVCVPTQYVCAITQVCVGWCCVWGARILLSPARSGQSSSHFQHPDRGHTTPPAATGRALPFQHSRFNAWLEIGNQDVLWTPRFHSYCRGAYCDNKEISTVF